MQQSSGGGIFLLGKNGKRGDQPLETGTVGEKRQIVREAEEKGT